MMIDLISESDNYKSTDIVSRFESCAILASSSAISFPRIPVWEGTPTLK